LSHKIYIKREKRQKKEKLGGISLQGIREKEKERQEKIEEESHK
jgi:hypothetical protein